MIRSDNLSWVCRTVFEITSNQLSPEKEYLVESRLTPFSRDMGCTHLNDYIDFLRSNADEDLLATIAESLTINETSFFRDVSPFHTLANEVIPTLTQNRHSLKRLNIWCAACSTGQEPYSLAMMLLEHFPQLADWDINILATDICKRVIKQAKIGVYSQHEINRGLPARLLVQYFEPAGKDWKISEKIRKMVTFKEMNLCKPWPNIPPMDLILLRNVMIYFGENCRRNVLSRIRGNLLTDGYLLLGTSETLLFSDQQFTQAEGCATSLYQARSTPPSATSIIKNI